MFDAGSVLEGLNDEQRAAATHQGGPLRVLAGPGTGKTTTLTARVAWLVAGGVPPDRILLLTFTRRAARQMLARSEALLAQARARGPPGGCAAAPSTPWPTRCCAVLPPGWACPRASAWSTQRTPPTCSTSSAPTSGSRRRT